MNTPRLPRQHSVNRVARQVLDAMRRQGESLLVLNLLNPSEQNQAERCPVCYNPVYKQSDTSVECQICFGTTFKTGVKSAARVYGIVTDTSHTEKRTSRGEWEPDNRRVTLPAVIPVRQHDIVIRVRKWVGGLPVGIEGVYQLGPVEESTVRDGSMLAQISETSVSFSGSLERLPETSLWYKWPTSGFINSIASDKLFVFDDLPSQLSTPHPMSK